MLRQSSLPLWIFLLLTAGLVKGEEIILKNGEKIVGRMVAIKGDSIQVKTSYGRIKVPRARILTINFTEDQPKPVSAGGPSPELLVVDESLDGTEYINRTGKFKLTLPSGWKINDQLRREVPDVLAGLTSNDGMVHLTVTQETFDGSVEAYKDVTEVILKTQMPDYEKLSESDATIDGKHALFMIVRAETGESSGEINLPINVMFAFLPYDSGVTKISGFTIEPLFSKAQGLYEKIMLSYETITE